jgi:sugar phosphate permease
MPQLCLSRRWMIFFLAGLLFLLSQFYRASMAVIYPAMTAELALDARSLGQISAAFFYAFALMQLPIGLYLDRRGPRLTMTVLTLVAVAGALLFARGQSLHALVAGRALLGIGMACNLMGTLKLITLWFAPGRFATLSALMITLGTVGNLAAATPLVLLVEAVGWRMSFQLLAALTLLLALVFYAVVRDGPAPGAATSGAAPGAAARSASIWSTLRALFVEKDYWIISLGTFCRYGIYAAVQALWAGPYLIQVLEVAPLAAGHLLFLMSIGMAAGCPLCGWLSDDILRSRKVVIVGGLLGMLAVLAVLAYLNAGVGFGWLAALFVAFGVFSSAGQIMYAHIKERMPMAFAGTAMTGINFFTMAGVAFFLEGVGSLLQRLDPQAALGPAAFRGALLFCCGCLLLAAAMYLLTRETLRRPAAHRPRPASEVDGAAPRI